MVMAWALIFKIMNQLIYPLIYILINTGSVVVQLVVIVVPIVHFEFSGGYGGCNLPSYDATYSGDALNITYPEVITLSVFDSSLVSIYSVPPEVGILSAFGTSSFINSGIQTLNTYTLAGVVMRAQRH